MQSLIRRNASNLLQRIFGLQQGATMPRPSWSGTIQISLVNFAVDVFPAVSSTRPISFHEVDRKTLSRIHHQNVSAGPPLEEDAGAEEDASDHKRSTKHASGMHIAAKSSAVE